MTTLRYVGPADAVYVPALGQVVLASEPVDVTDDLADALLAQPANWQVAPAPKAPKPAPAADTIEE